MKRIVLLLSPLVILLSPIIDAFQGVYIDPRSDAGYAVIACVAIIGLALGMIATVCYKRGAVGNVVTAGTLAVTLFLFGDLSYGVFWRLADHIGMGGRRRIGVCWTGCTYSYPIQAHGRCAPYDGRICRSPTGLYSS